MGVGRAFNLVEAAAYLGIHPNTLHRHYREKRLPGRRDMLRQGGPTIFMQSDLDEFRDSRIIVGGKEVSPEEVPTT